MDDRIHCAKIGKPIPDWDKKHRLPVSGWVGPDCKDSATTFRINSTFMEVTEQSHMVRQWFAGGVLVAAFMVTGMAILMIAVLNLLSLKGWPMAGVLSLIVPVVGVLGFGTVLIRFGTKEFFAREKYPVRFNRKDQKVYAIVRGPKIRGSCPVVEMEWSESSFFCVHHAAQDGDHYWIRYYEVDPSGMVQRTVAIGRDWEGIDGLEDLIAQWNYWCWYMNRGPVGLPKPCLYLPEKESLLESFLYCLYEIDFQADLKFRIFAMPVAIMLACFRILALLTCTPPSWPSFIVDACRVDHGDPFDEPRGCTPIGWNKTNIAISNGNYPAGDQKRIIDWLGEADGKRNAQLWAAKDFSSKAASSPVV